MANTSSSKDKYIWQIYAPQANHIFGYFETLKEARKIARILYEPEMREELSFLHCIEEDGTDVYLIWSEPLHDCFMDTPELEIRQLRLGQVRPYTAPIEQEKQCHLPHAEDAIGVSSTP